MLLYARTWPVAFPPASLPAFETFGIEHEITVSYLFALFSNLSPFSSFGTLAFLEFDLTDGFMEELVRFASNGKGTYHLDLVGPGRLVNPNGNLPSSVSLDAQFVRASQWLISR